MTNAAKMPLFVDCKHFYKLVIVDHAIAVHIRILQHFFNFNWVNFFTKANQSLKEEFQLAQINRIGVGRVKNPKSFTYLFLFIMILNERLEVQTVIIISYLFKRR